MNSPFPNTPEQLRDLGEPEFRKLIVDLVGQYAEAHHQPAPFVAGQSAVPVSGKVYGAHDMQLLAESCLDFWLTTGRFNDQFESRLSKYIGVDHALTVNSGSSANLVAFSTLTSHYLRAKQQLVVEEESTAHQHLRRCVARAELRLTPPEYSRS